MTMNESRRNFLKRCGQAFGLLALSSLSWRIFFSRSKQSEFVQPLRRFAWQINPDKCKFCGRCAPACVMNPPAVKAVNDQVKCANCVVCYGHLADRRLDSHLIQSTKKLICPNNAVIRRNYSGGIDGYYTYVIDQKRCNGCAKCALECNQLGSASMFLIIRPDLCLGCNRCAAAVACPHDAIERIPLGYATDRRNQLPTAG